MVLKPLRDCILVKPELDEGKTKSGIILAKETKEAPVFGLILEKGEQVDGMLKGDRILFRRYAGDEVKLEGETILVIREEDVVAVCES